VSGERPASVPGAAPVGGPRPAQSLGGHRARRLAIGVMLSSGRTSPAEIAPRARHVEALGLDALFVGDHLAAAVPVMDSTVTLAVVAGATERIRLGFGVMVLALRHPAWAAKQIATLQRLSGDRVILGVGSGGAAHGSAAFEAVGVPFGERGRRTDAALAVLPQLISGKPTRLPSGASIALEPGAAVPPVWVGGGSAAALRRSVDHGSAWFPSQVPAGWVHKRARRMVELASQRGRPSPGIAVGGSVLLGSPASSPALAAHVAALTGMGCRRRSPPACRSPGARRWPPNASPSTPGPAPPTSSSGSSARTGSDSAS
jgi:alkanesulfonate monooxygenase SsuD/methylene tetrahydromethanopterin reductase-like flavin-dependent oxidoreductase (luciferase family)